MCFCFYSSVNMYVLQGDVRVLDLSVEATNSSLKMRIAQWAVGSFTIGVRTLSIIFLIEASRRSSLRFLRSSSLELICEAPHWSSSLRLFRQTTLRCSFLRVPWGFSLKLLLEAPLTVLFEAPLRSSSMLVLSEALFWGYYQKLPFEAAPWSSSMMLLHESPL